MVPFQLRFYWIGDNLLKIQRIVKKVVPNIFWVLTHYNRLVPDWAPCQGSDVYELVAEPKNHKLLIHVAFIF